MANELSVGEYKELFNGEVERLKNRFPSGSEELTAENAQFAFDYAERLEQTISRLRVKQAAAHRTALSLLDHLSEAEREKIRRADLTFKPAITPAKETKTQQQNRHQKSIESMKKLGLPEDAIADLMKTLAQKNTDAMKIKAE